MLILTRQENESVKIGDDIEVVITKISQGRVRLGFIAPSDVQIDRKEIWLSKKLNFEGTP